MENLSDKQREYAIAYSQGMTMAQIAETYGVNKSTVSRTLARAFRRIAWVIDTTIIMNEEGEVIG